jgi:hypothetical protein
VYVRRYNFADEAPLVHFLHAHGCGCELSKGDFASGNWLPAFERVALTTPAARPQPMTGGIEAAKTLLQYFQ